MKKKKTPLSPKSTVVDRRIHVLFFAIFAVFTVLVFRLWTIQIYRQEFYQKAAVGNYVRTIPVLSERGRILDRNGRILAENIHYWDVWLPIVSIRGRRVVSEEMRETLTLLSTIVNKPYETLEHQYLHNPKDEFKKLRVRIAKAVPFPVFAAIEARKIEFPEEAMVFTEAVQTRRYRYGDLASHVLGRTGPIDPYEAKLPQYQDYAHGTQVGKSGIEKQYESFLHGKDGLDQVVVDKFEIQQGAAVELEPTTPGNDVVLNIDYDLQLAAEQILGASRGVIIVADPRDHSILAMASSPRFNANEYNEKFGRYLLNPEAPLLHRAIQGKYPPGSVFKIFEAFALLESEKINPKSTVFCPGFFERWGIRWRCHLKHGHGHVDLYEALRVSCNVYFYEMVGKRMGIRPVEQWCNYFGLTQKTGIDLPEETNPALFPSRDTMRDWAPGVPVNNAIGQGGILMTPIQISTGLCAIANGGKVYPPRVAKRIVNQHGDVIETFQSLPSGIVEAATKSWDAVKLGMWQVINQGGTGRRIKDESSATFTLLGKTGTAQAGIGRQDHAWFVCFGPQENPEIAITILVENSGHGGEIASPMAKVLIDLYRMIKAGDIESAKQITYGLNPKRLQ